MLRLVVVNENGCFMFLLIESGAHSVAVQVLGQRHGIYNVE